jgi:hypothetical protein
MAMLRWLPGGMREIALEEIGQQYARYRLTDVAAEQSMLGSLQRYGQVAPIIVCVRNDQAQLIDGFKRLAAARKIECLSTLSARVIDADDRSVKAAILCLNRGGGHTQDLEEAWIVRALIREDGLSQVEVAEILGRHKSWVCRRMAMLEKLSPRVLEDLRLGLVSSTAARHISRLPQGNQEEAVVMLQRESLSCQELQGVVDLLLTSGHRRQQEFILQQPRQALKQANGIVLPTVDPRLSKSGNRVSKRLGMLLDLLARLRNWIEHRGYDDLTLSDQSLLAGSFERVAVEAAVVVELCKSHLPGVGREQ